MTGMTDATTSHDTPPQYSGSAQDMHQVHCCIAGGGPAGVMLGLLLARHGLDVLVLEKHHDFLRDFRGDTLHPSTLEIMAELGLADQLLRRPHTKVPVLRVQTPQGVLPLADFRHLKTRYPYLTFMPQWDFLDFLAGEARRCPGFRLLMDAEVRELVMEDGVVRGLGYQAPDGWHTVRALLTVAADGRSSRVRQQAGLSLIETSPPMDVLWFRLSRRPDDPTAVALRVGGGHVLIFIDRSDFWQIAYVIPKGANEQVRAAGLAAFRQSLRTLAPELGDRVDELRDWEQVKLLTVQANRLRRWHRPGLLCIGDAAHAMSPVGGVGINLAIQDAVVAANVLAGPLKGGRVWVRDLAAVQRRRDWPTRIIQALQAAIQQRVTAPALRPDATPGLPTATRVFLTLPLLRDLPARLIAFGVWPVHLHGPLRQC
jgi:2-polyprenyl-6-methoxyphenol hydroxylase-like FAD-dependent oxidoreductase